MKCIRDKQGRIILCMTAEEYREVQDTITNEERWVSTDILQQNFDNVHLGSYMFIAVRDPSGEFYKANV